MCTFSLLVSSPLSSVRWVTEAEAAFARLDPAGPYGPRPAYLYVGQGEARVLPSTAL